MVVNLTEKYSVVSHWLTQLRDTDTQKDRLRFRKNIERIGEILAYEISKTLEYESLFTETPITTTITKILSSQPVIVSILRAGVPLFNGVLNIFDDADSAFVGSYRKEGADLEIAQEYVSKPSLKGRPVIITDTMLATGSSIISALDELLKDDPSVVHIACVIAAPEGIKCILDKYPEVNIWAASIDGYLNDKKYIVPGLGDAGDLCYGKKV